MLSLAQFKKYYLWIYSKTLRDNKSSQVFEAGVVHEIIWHYVVLYTDTGVSEEYDAFTFRVEGI